MFKKLDFLGSKLSFYHDSEEFTQTSFGGIITLFLILVLGLLIGGLGQDFFKRTNPSVITSTKTLQSPPVLNVNNKNFLMAIYIDTIYGESYEIDEQIMYIEAVYFSAIKKDGEFNVLEYKYLELEKCTPELIDDYDKHFSKVNNISNFYCPIADIKIGGSYNYDEIAKLNFYFKECREGEFNSKGQPCKPKTEFKAFTDLRPIFYFYYQRTLFDVDNYEKGLKTVISSETIRLDGQLYKQIGLYFSIITLINDYGWLLESLEEETYLGFTRSSYDTLLRSNFEGKNSQNFLMDISINITNEKSNILRIYTKGQTLAAQVGGILKIFLFIGTIIVTKFNLYSTYLSFSSILDEDFSLENKKNEDNSHLKEKSGNLINKIIPKDHI